MHSPQIAWDITPGISDHTFLDIHRAVLVILDRFGLRVATPELDWGGILERLTVPGVSFPAVNRITFTAELVENLLDEYRQDHLPMPSVPALETITAGTSGHVFFILDPLERSFSPCNGENLTAALRLTRALSHEGVHGICPGYPADVPTPLRELARYRINCEGGGMPMAPYPYQASSRSRDPRLYTYLHEMAQVMDGRGESDACIVGVHPISPLKLEGDEFDNAIYLWQTAHGDRMQVSIANMPIAGVSAPIDFPAALAQSIAESVGSWLFFRLLLGRGRADFSFNVYPFDMKHSCFAYGGPEDLVIALARRELYSRYGVQANWADKALHTMSHAPDAQAAGEKAPKVLACLLAGARRFTGLGGLCLDEGWSPEQCLIDLEIIHWASRVARGMPACGDDLVAHVAEGIANDGNFLSLEYTAREYRSLYFMPDLFEHIMKSQWDATGAPGLRDVARAKVQEALKSEAFELPEDKRRALANIYRQAERELLSQP